MESYLAERRAPTELRRAGTRRSAPSIRTHRRRRPETLPGGVVAPSGSLGARRARGLGRWRAAALKRPRPTRAVRRIGCRAEALRGGGAVPAVGRRPQRRTSGSVAARTAACDPRRSHDLHRIADRPPIGGRCALGRRAPRRVRGRRAQAVAPAASGAPRAGAPGLTVRAGAGPEGGRRRTPGLRRACLDRGHRLRERHPVAVRPRRCRPCNTVRGRFGPSSRRNRVRGTLGAGHRGPRTADDTRCRAVAAQR